MAYFSLNISPKSLKRLVVSLSSNTPIKHPPDPALFSQQVSLKDKQLSLILLWLSVIRYPIYQIDDTLSIFQISVSDDIQLI